MVVSRRGPARFSTVGLPPARRLELWERYNATALIGLSCKTITDAPLAATERNLWLAHVEIAEVTGNPHMVERTRAQIRRHPADSAVLYVALAGEAFFYHDAGVHVVRPGQAILCDADMPFVRGFANGLTELALRVPRTVFDGLAERAPLTGPRLFDLSAPANAHGHALTARMRAALHAAPEPDVEAELLDLLRTMVIGARAGNARSHFDAAQVFVERHLAEPELSAGRVAAAIGISERQLSRVFSPHGGIARWITDRRLDRARELLAAPGVRSVADTARECGFTSASYFARAFKQRFGQTPVEAMRTLPPSG